MKELIEDLISDNDRRIALLSNFKWLDGFDTAMANNSASVLKSQNKKLLVILATEAE